MNRAEHMAWCKKRALEYCDMGDARAAFASMASDLSKHPETAGHKGMDIGFQLQMMGALNSSREMRRFIEGFN